MPIGRRSTPLTALWLCALLICGPGIASAGQAYVGLGIGNAGSSVDKESVQFGTEDWSPDASIWKLLAGYRITSHVGIEGGYTDLGSARVTTQGGSYFETNVTGVELTPVGILPVGKRFSAFVRAGLVFWDSDISYRFAALGSGTRKESGNDISLSLGAQFSISKQIGVRAEYSRHAIDKSKAGSGDYNVLSLNGVFAF